jgi:hypothetical protein
MKTITFTGIDEETSLPDLNEIRDARVEWGILYTHTPEGRPRYPRREWILEAVQILHGRCALHICGRGAREELLNGGLADVTPYVARVQINGAVEAPTVEEACSILGKHRQTVITQHAHGNERLIDQVKAWNHSVLVDASGGRGLTPNIWARPVSRKPVGFAGGLGPSNVADQVRRLLLIAGRGWWIDMEAKIRDERDRFSLSLTQAVLEQLEEVPV